MYDFVKKVEKFAENFVGSVWKSSENLCGKLDIYAIINNSWWKMFKKAQYIARFYYFVSTINVWDNVWFSTIST